MDPNVKLIIDELKAIASDFIDLLNR